MARARGVFSFLSGLVSGAASFFGQLAELYRVPGGGASAGQQVRPGRQRLSAPEIRQAAIEAGIELAPAGATRWSQSFLCIYTDPDTGQVIARIRVEQQYDEGTARSTVYSRARRAAKQLLYSPQSAAYRIVNLEDLKYIIPNVTCRQIRGTRKEVPN